MVCSYREKKYLCGDYMDVQIYPVYRKSGARRSKAKPTSEVQQKLNEENSKRAFSRIIHTNFSQKDIALHLTYADEYLPKDEETAKADVQKLLRKLRAKYKAIGKELKYVWVCEKGEKSARIHHHLILSFGVDRDVIEGLWAKGYANSKRLKFTERGIEGLAIYMTKQKLFFKRWNGSKNLIHPQVTVDDYRYSGKKVKELYEYAVMPTKFTDYYPKYACYDAGSIECVKNERNQGYYISLRMYRLSGFGRRC